MLSDYPAKFGVNRPYGTENNGVCNIISNSNSNSNAEIPMPRFTNGHKKLYKKVYKNFIKANKSSIKAL